MAQSSRVTTALSRARYLQLPATLTDEEWQRTVNDFGGLCAYCGEVPFAHLEHFIGIVQGGGSTPGNCLPSCIACNNKKAKKTPEQYDALFGEERVARLQAYLAARSLGLDVGVPVVPAGGPIQTAFRLPTELLEGLDALVERVNEHRPWPKMTRSDLVRLVLSKTVEEPPEWLLGAPDAE